MHDQTITGSYLRQLRWTTETPHENEQARQRRFEQIKARSLATHAVTFQHAKLELGLMPEDDHMMAWYRILDLDGEWPGGDCILQSLKLVFGTGSAGARIDLEMLPAPLHGLTAWKREWGIGFPRQPLVRRFPLAAGEYQFAVRAQASYHQRPCEEQVPLGKVTIPAGHCWPGYGAGNDLMVRWADFDLYAGHPCPPLKAAVSPPAWLEPYFAALDEAVEWVKRWHHCPRGTCNWYAERTPLEGYSWSDRYQGFYLSAFVPAYLLTGRPAYFQMCEYLYNSVLLNIVPGSWGGPTMNQSLCDTGDNLLHCGIVARAVLRLAKMMGDIQLARPVYEIFAAWPRDRKHGGRLINVVFPDLTEQRLPFNYNQTMSSVAGVWPLARAFGDQDLLDVAERMWHEHMRPGFQEEGYWFYMEGQPVVTQHYDLVMKSDASLWLEYERWAKEEDFRDVMRRSMNYALEHYAEQVGDVLVWQPFYSGKWESTLAVGKAGMALEIMTRLVKAGLEEFAEPACMTARFIEAMREKPDLRDMWPCSWMCAHVTAPLLEAALAGLFDK